MGARDDQTDPAGCLGVDELEALAENSEIDVTGADRAHLDRCERCRAALAEVVANHRFMHRMAVAFRASTAPNAGHDRERVHDGDRSAPPALPGFRMLEELHRGGQGIVYRAVHEASGRAAAVKVLGIGSARRRARMQREAQLAATLSHRNIVTLLDCGDLPDGRYALAMELIDGEPLDRWALAVARSDATPRARQRRVLEVFGKICGAVQHAHQNGVIHRDLKPDNILVDADDEPHVLDFGVACRADRGGEHGAAGRVTATGELACTLAYAAPEQVAGDGERTDARTDVYALGRLLYELLTGQTPYPVDGSFAQVIDSIAHRDPTPMRSVKRGAGAAPIGDDLEIIARKALAKDPEHRYRTAAELQDDVRHVLAGDAISARRDSVTHLLRKAVRRHRGAVAAASVALLAAVAGVAAIILAHLRSVEATSRAAIEEARSQAETRRAGAVAAVLRELVPAESRTRAFGEGSEAHRAVTALSERIDAGLFADDVEAAAATRVAIGEVCRDRGAPRLAEEHLRLAVRSLSLRDEPEDAMLADALDGLARVLLDRNVLTEAAEHCGRALALRRALLGEAHPLALESTALLARIELAQGRADDAAARCDAALRPREGASIDDFQAQAALLEVRSEIARRRSDAADAVDAVVAAEEAVRIRLRHAGDADPTVPRALRVLAEALAEIDPTQSTALTRLAEDLSTVGPAQRDPASLETLLDLKARLLSPDDPDRLETLIALAPLLRARGQSAAALAATDAALALAIRQYGEDDLRVADLLLERVRARGMLDPLDEQLIADRLRRLEILRKVLPGRDDFFLAVDMREVAMLLMERDHDAAAEARVDEVLEFLRRRFGSDHRELAWALGQSGGSLVRAGQPQRGRTRIAEALTMMQRIDPNPNWYTACMHGWMAQACGELGMLDEAARHLERFDAMTGGDGGAGGRTTTDNERWTRELGPIRRKVAAAMATPAPPRGAGPGDQGR